MTDPTREAALAEAYVAAAKWAGDGRPVPIPRSFIPFMADALQSARRERDHEWRDGLRVHVLAGDAEAVGPVEARAAVDAKLEAARRDEREHSEWECIRATCERCAVGDTLSEGAEFDFWHEVDGQVYRCDALALHEMRRRREAPDNG